MVLSNGKKGKLTVLYDNRACREDLTTGWGFSCLVETHGLTLLFDTGWDGPALLHNMDCLGVDPARIAVVVISHGHWDHMGGLALFLAANPRVSVYVPRSLSPRLKGEIAARAHALMEVGDAAEIAPGVRTTGELGDTIREQALLLESPRGVVVLTGCAHPGIGRILAAAHEVGDVRGLVGGFHGFRQFELLRPLDVVAPCHCTQHIDRIAELYPDSYVRCCGGVSLEF
jgi:7,8-dihydropterin-6-yl-methyl-4-(beta-D-ribofuranosyl)aminobenzene 5'-phosphate synthase